MIVKYSMFLMFLAAVSEWNELNCRMTYVDIGEVKLTIRPNAPWNVTIYVGSLMTRTEGTIDFLKTVPDSTENATFINVYCNVSSNIDNFCTFQPSASVSAMEPRSSNCFFVAQTKA